LNKTNPEILKIYLTKLKKSWSDLDNILNLLNNWEIIVGKDMAKECKPLKIEKKVLTIVANQLQWRQALIYNKHKLKESISKTGIDLKNIRIIQNYEDKFIERKLSDNNSNWDNHPSRIKDKGLINCSICDRPTPIGEIERWGKCTFCWRETN
tara:strand:+ start:236 stop:694 length:459 start_codon:yes stop_codon:yes gene_type:complete